MKRQRVLRLLSLLFAFSLVAAACGGSDTASDSGTDTDTEGGGSIDEGSVDDALNSADEEPEEGAEDEEPAVEPQSIEELEEYWAATGPRSSPTSRRTATAWARTGS